MISSNLSTKLTHLTMHMLVALALLAGVATGCDRGDTKARPSALAPEASPEEPSPVPEAEEPAETGEPCKRDADCRTYFRCFDATCITPPAMTGEVRPDSALAQFVVDGEQIASFRLELALTPPQMSRGLMYRPSMKDGWGMLFVYPQDGPRSFWMKNTIIPLDMVFISEAGVVVGIVEGAEPLTLEPRRVDAMSRYVLELNAGVARESGIVKGAQMRLENAPPSAMPR